MADGFDFRLVSHDNLCTHCVYAWPESTGFSCSVLRNKRCKALVLKCWQYEPNCDEKRRLMLAERSEA